MKKRALLLFLGALFAAYYVENDKSFVDPYCLRSFDGFGEYPHGSLTIEDLPISTFDVTMFEQVEALHIRGTDLESLDLSRAPKALKEVRSTDCPKLCEIWLRSRSQADELYVDCNLSTIRYKN